ncbi:MAG: GerAB/ArcD/ProY family transporter [Cellulosilyticaceae bacterium]
MYTHNRRVSVHQAKLMLVLMMFNTSILILPRIVGKTSGHDGYFLPIIGLVLGLIYTWVITALTQRFSGESFARFAPKIIGRPLGIILSVLFAIKLLISAGLEMRMFAEMICQVLLPKTPVEVIILLMLFAITYLIKSGVEASGRMAEVLVYFVFIPLVLVLALVAVKTDYQQLLPIFTSNWGGAARGAYYVSMTFMPLEMVLMLAAFMKRPKRVRGVCIWALIIIAIIETIIIVLTFTGVGVVETTRQIWPVLTLMQSIQLPGSFVENQEILMMSWWVLSIYMYVSGGMYFAANIFSTLLNFERENVTVLPVLPIVFFVAMLPETLVDAYKAFVNFQGKVGIFFLFIVPLLLLIIAKIRKVGGENE